ncbi:MAG: phytase [Acidimicrobiia bacterium]|nr:phytase [Acidimicrobiia bacterium]
MGATAWRLTAAAVSLCVLGACGAGSGADSGANQTTTTQVSPIPSTLPGIRSTSDVLSRTVPAAGETTPVLRSGDVSEDVAIWVDPTDPGRSTIIGTDSHGIAVYDLGGGLLQYLKDGRLQSVDIRKGFGLGGRTVDLVTAGNRDTNTLAIYVVDPVTRTLTNVAARPIQPTLVTFGSCMYRSATTGTFSMFVTSAEGTVEQWELFEVGGRVDARKTRELSIAPGQALGACVADDGLARLYVGEKKGGIWRYGAEPDATEPAVKIDAIGSTGHLAADVEGLTIAYEGDAAGYLIASSEGNNSYSVYRRSGPNAFVQRFDIRGGLIDGAEDSDGIDVTTANLGPAFPDGIFVAQDRSNDDGNQNFKLVPWGGIVAPQ